MAKEKSKQNRLKRLNDQLRAHSAQGEYSGKVRSMKTRLLLEISRIERSK